MSDNLRVKDGFLGEKLINVPQKTIKELKDKNPELFKVYITEIGYFPKARYHYRERTRGCDDNILIYCLNGKGYYVIDGLQFTVSSNEYIILPATDKYLRYWADKDDPWTIYWIHYTGDDIGAFNKALNLTVTRNPRQIGYNDKGVELWTNIYQNLSDGYSLDNLCCANFSLYHLVSTFLFFDVHTRKQDYSVNLISRTIDHMRNNLDAKLTVSEMAEINHLSVSYFTVLFKKSTGITPVEYFNQLKMQKAGELLLNNDGNVKSIAKRLGYDDPYYFSRLFKKVLGSAPSGYRNLTQVFLQS